MEKGDALSFGAEARGLVDEPDGGSAAALEGGVEVVDDEADVMNAGAAFCDELCDGRVCRGGLEQLDERLAGGETGDTGSVGIIEGHLRHTEDVAIKGNQRVESLHGDADMGDAGAARGTGRGGQGR